MKKLLSTTAAAFLICAPVVAAPVYLNFHEADLRSTIMTIARAGGINVSVDDSVKGTISINLNDIAPEKALEIIAKTNGLNLIKESSVYILTAKMNIVSPMKSYVLPIKYGNPKKLRKAIFKILDFSNEEKILEEDTIIEDAKGVKRTARYDPITGLRKVQITSNATTGKRADETKEEYEERKDEDDEDDPRAARVFVNSEVNAIILFGTESEYERAKKLLEELDIELKQVSVEARILAIDKDASKNLGVEWFWSSIPQTSVYRRENMREANAYGLIQFGRPFDGIRNEFYFSAQLNALISNGKAKVLSRPNVTTVQGHEAIINVGSSVPISRTSTTNSTVTTSFEYHDVGIILKYTPRINADGTITAVIHTEVSTPQYVSDLKAYQFNTRSADTTVTVRDGEAMVIGGLIGAEDAKSISKIPFLGDLPILGALFRNHRKSKTESELMIFLTAHVIHGAGVGAPKNVKYSTPTSIPPHEFLADEK